MSSGARASPGPSGLVRLVVRVHPLARPTNGQVYRPVTMGRTNGQVCRLVMRVAVPPCPTNYQHYRTLTRRLLPPYPTIRQVHWLVTMGPPITHLEINIVTHKGHERSMGSRAKPVQIANHTLGELSTGPPLARTRV